MIAVGSSVWISSVCEALRASFVDLLKNTREPGLPCPWLTPLTGVEVCLLLTRESDYVTECGQCIC